MGVANNGKDLEKLLAEMLGGTRSKQKPVAETDEVSNGSNEDDGDGMEHINAEDDEDTLSSE